MCMGIPLCICAWSANRLPPSGAQPFDYDIGPATGPQIHFDHVVPQTDGSCLRTDGACNNPYAPEQFCFEVTLYSRAAVIEFQFEIRFEDSQLECSTNA